MADIKLLVEEIARAIVETPDGVEVRESKAGTETVYELKVAAGDIGKVIGKQGRTARSIRTLLNAVGERDRRRYQLEIVE
jgi:predicted RNA-binding protein YlqC (UPF0109 family)